MWLRCILVGLTIRLRTVVNCVADEHLAFTACLGVDTDEAVDGLRVDVASLVGVDEEELRHCPATDRGNNRAGSVEAFPGGQCDFGKAGIWTNSSGANLRSRWVI